MNQRKPYTGLLIIAIGLLCLDIALRMFSPNVAFAAKTVQYKVVEAKMVDSGSDSELAGHEALLNKMGSQGWVYSHGVYRGMVFYK